MKPLAFLVVLLALVLPLAAQRDAAQDSPPYKTLADVPEELQQRFITFAQKFEADLRSGHGKRALRALDTEAMADSVLAVVDADGDMAQPLRDGLRQGLAKGLKESATTLAATWQTPDATFKHLTLHGGQVAARFRFVDKHSALALIDLVLAQRPDGQIRIANVDNLTLGADIVGQSCQLAMPILGSLKRSAWERLFGSSDFDLADVERFGTLPAKLASGDLQGAVDTYRSLSEGLQHTKAATMLYLIALMRSEDMVGYRDALEAAGKRFGGHGGFDFMLIDLYFLDKHYDKAIACVDACMKAIEPDAGLLTLRANIQLTDGDADAARASVDEALRLEPDCVFALVRRVDVLLAQKDFAALRDSLVALEKTGRYTFKGALGDPVWDDFLKAPESQPWR